MDFDISAIGAFVAGVSADEYANGDGAVTGRVFRTTSVFVLGFTSVFVLLGVTATFVGEALTCHLATLSIIAGAVIAVMGLHFLGLLRMWWLNTTKRVEVQRKPRGMLGGYDIGLAFAFGWTPSLVQCWQQFFSWQKATIRLVMEPVRYSLIRLGLAYCFSQLHLVMRPVSPLCSTTLSVNGEGAGLSIYGRAVNRQVEHNNNERNFSASSPKAQGRDHGAIGLSLCLQ